jgi:FAD/FMN-containing dehydrogenase
MRRAEPTVKRSSDLGAPWDQLTLPAEAKLLQLGQEGYDEATLQANSQYADIKPARVAMCASADDVAACMKFAGAHKVPLVPRTGGHSYAGLSTTTGLVVNVSRLNKVTVNTETGVAVVGGGALNRDLLAQTRGTAWFLPVGTCPGVGVGGLTLGGGIGYNTHWAGLTCDQMTETTIITPANPDPAVIRPSGNKAHDLFWACQGGAGGNFGINTSFTFNLVKVPPKVTYYELTWRGGDKAESVLNAFHKILASAPNEFNAVARATAVPVGSNEGKRDAIAVWTRGQFIGSQQDLLPHLQPLLDIGGRTSERIQEMPFWEAQDLFTGNVAKPHGFGDISRYAAKPVEPGDVTDLVSLLADCPSRSADANGAFWSMGWVGGAGSAKERTDTAYVHRKMQALLRPTPVWPAGASGVATDLLAWTDAMAKIVSRNTPNESYQNFPSLAIKDWRQQYYAENFGDLLKVKGQADPTNLIQSAQSIAG